MNEEHKEFLIDKMIQQNEAKAVGWFVVLIVFCVYLIGEPKRNEEERALFRSTMASTTNANPIIINIKE